MLKDGPVRGLLMTKTPDGLEDFKTKRNKRVRGYFNSASLKEI
jgi:hypothetical protein